MTIQECYAAMGADYEDVIRRLRKEERVQKFLLKVLEDPSFQLLCSALEEGNMEEAFRAVHTIKGICQNLSLTSLGNSSSQLCEKLRGAQEYSQEIEPLFEQVKQDYNRITECIHML